MRSLVVVEHVSLDGVIQALGHADEDPEGGFAHGGWTGPFMADHRRLNSQLYPTAGAFLLGRRTYEIFAAYWPAVTDEGDRRPAAGRRQCQAGADAGGPWPGRPVPAVAAPPVVLGSGKRLFANRDGAPVGLRLVDSTTTGSGLVLLTYQTHQPDQPARPASPTLTPPGQSIEAKR